MTRNTQILATPNAASKPLHIVLAGGSGHIGRVLSRHFHRQGHAVTVLSRSGAQAPWRVLVWDGVHLRNWTGALENADALINLSGRSVNCRYNRANRREIVESRVQPTTGLGEAISQLQNPPRIWMNASTATIYRHALSHDMDEYSGEIGGKETGVPGSWSYSMEVAKRWEEAFFERELPRTRRIALRSGIMMSPDRGGAFEVLLRLVRFGLGGTVGDGRQYVSWIHENDFVHAIEHLIERESLSGPVNVTSPSPIPNAEFMSALRCAWGTRIGLSASRWMLEFGTFLLRTEPELVLKSRRVVPRRLLDDGFVFQFADWEDAAWDLVRRWRNQRRGTERPELRLARQGGRLHERTN